ncbi:MAG: HAD family hydrolase [Parachlamydiales bacterium]|nr:HAD family hydrolase [Parachlamydiales bacterium]
MHFKAILFDLDRTLAYDHHLELDTFRLLVQKFNIPASDADLLIVLNQFRSGQLPLNSALGQAFTKWGLSQQESQEAALLFRKQVLTEAHERVEAVEGFNEVISEVEKRKIPYAMLTNGWKELQDTKASIIGFKKEVLSSEELKAWKPDIQLFSKALQRLKFNANDTVYVGDSPESDMVGAKEAGMQTIWANFQHQQYPSGIVKPDAIIEKFTDLITLLPLPS